MGGQVVLAYLTSVNLHNQDMQPDSIDRRYSRGRELVGLHCNRAACCSSYKDPKVCFLPCHGRLRPTISVLFISRAECPFAGVCGSPREEILRAKSVYHPYKFKSVTYLSNICPISVRNRPTRGLPIIARRSAPVPKAGPRRRTDLSGHPRA